jgi:hypothetical protein
MAKSFFTVEILETWVKKVKVTAESRGDALAKAKADFISEKSNSDNHYIAHEPDAEFRDIDFKLEWPDGNPEVIEHE